LTGQPFNLGSGFPQGSPPSPNQFNICEQLIIFKFELDPRIKKIKPLVPLPVLAPVPVPVPVPVLDPDPVPDPPRVYGMAESNGETGKVEAFADDTTPMGRLELTALTYIKNSLEQFAAISGLKCNVDKSQILITGTEGDIPDFVHESGFTITDSVTILGFKITKNCDDLWQNFERVIERVRSQANFWARFRLSLVAKTMMLSQISYFGSILKIPDDMSSTLADIINNYISSNLRISKNLICTGISKGGLGFIDIKTFVNSLQCSWIKRSVDSTIDVTPTVPRTTIPRTTIPRTTFPRTTVPRSDNP
jgi:hypothetical protein